MEQDFTSQTDLEIADVIYKYITGTMNPAEEKQLTDWINLSRANKEQFEQMTSPEWIKTHWNQFRSADIEAALAVLKQRGVIGAPVRRMHTGWRRMIAAAAVIGLVVLGGWWWMTRDNGEQPGNSVVSTSVKTNADVAPGGNKATLQLADGRTITLDSLRLGTIASLQEADIKKTGEGQLVYNAKNKLAGQVFFNTISIPAGGKFSLVLSDGTKVWLNAASTLRYPTVFSGDSRRVEITGEAYFEVAHNKLKPFVVNLQQGAEVQVLGTRFNVMAYSDEVRSKITLLEGSVRVSQPAAQRLRMLVPGQQALVDDNEIALNPRADLQQAIAWKDDIFYLKGTDIKTLMRQIARWYDVEVVYTGPIDETRTITGEAPRNTSLATLIKLLQLTDVNCRIEDGKRLIVMPNQK